MERKVLYGLGILVAIVAIFIFFGNGEIKNYPPKDGPIVMFGDSLAAGVGSTKGNDLASLLSRKIGEPIENFGVSGNTTAQGLARIDSVLAREPRITILVLGGNDALRKVPIEETFSNLRSIVRRLQDSGSIVVILGVRSGVLNDRYDSYYEALAEETGSAYVEDILSGLFADSRYMSDAIHPNDAGYARIANRVYPVLKDLIR